MSVLISIQGPFNPFIVPMPAKMVSIVADAWFFRGHSGASHRASFRVCVIGRGDSSDPPFAAALPLICLCSASALTLFCLCSALLCSPPLVSHVVLACFRESAASNFGHESGGLRWKPSLGCVVDMEPIKGGS